jgi:hypothetical protein
VTSNDQETAVSNREDIMIRYRSQHTLR